jgi:hypothetical protein
VPGPTMPLVSPSSSNSSSSSSRVSSQCDSSNLGLMQAITIKASMSDMLGKQQCTSRSGTHLSLRSMPRKTMRQGYAHCQRGRACMQQCLAATACPGQSRPWCRCWCCCCLHSPCSQTRPAPQAWLEVGCPARSSDCIPKHSTAGRPLQPAKQRC